MTPSLRDSLAQVVALLDRATPGQLEVMDDNEGQWPPRPLWIVTNNMMAVGDSPEDEPWLEARIDYGTEADARLFAAAVNFLRAHSAEIAGALRDADGWQPIESAPRDGSYILVCNSHGSWIAKYQHFYPSGYRPSSPWASMMLNHDHIEKPGRLDHPTHWRPLPAPPTDDAARAGERGGE